MVDKSVVEDFLKAIQPADKNTDHTYNATVTRVDKDGVVWVQVAGSDKETPTSSTSSEVKRGDAVNVQWRNNKLYVAGNYTNPSAGSVRVRAVEVAAQVANQAASNAVADAGVARQAAESAQSDAARAKSAADGASEYAARAFGNLSTVQSITETLTWITQHGTMTLTTDVALDPTHVYFVQDAGGDYVVGGVTYAVVTEPDVADIGTYYELSIDESLNNYVGTHLALTSEGLWLIPDDTQGSNKVLIAVGGQGHTYEQAGTYILDGSDNVLAQFLASGAQIGQTGESHLEMDYHSMQLVDREGNPYFYVSDSRDRDGNVYIEDTIESTGQLQSYRLSHICDTTKQISVYVNGSLVSDENYSIGFNQLLQTSRVDFTYTPQIGTIIVEYYAIGQNAKALTFGIRNGEVGAMSVGLGYNVVADGTYSFAEGQESVASGATSHAEGWGALAGSSCCHAEGNHTKALGVSSHASGYYTQANYGQQFVCGAYNDNKSGNAFEIGNGTADNARSNALTVDWDGDVCLALDTTAASGTDHDLYAAITAMGWQSDVIV